LRAKSLFPDHQRSRLLLAVLPLGIPSPAVVDGMGEQIGRRPSTRKSDDVNADTFLGPSHPAFPLRGNVS